MLPHDNKVETGNRSVRTDWRGRLTPLFAGTCASAVLVVGGLVAIGAFVAPSDDIRAASISSSASVTIEESSSGIISVSNFEVGVAPTASDATESDVAAETEEEETEASTFLREQINQTSQISPARFTVFGQPNQVFAVTVPSTVVSSGGAGDSVTFSDFSHDAGVTPVTGGSGSAVFAVGAAAQVNLEVTPASGAASPNGNSGAGGGSTGGVSGDTDTPSDTQTADAAGTDSGEEAADDTPPKRSDDPFGFKSSDEKFLNVLVSYN